MTPGELTPDPDMTAAELALGALEVDDRVLALRRVLADPAFAHEVEAWRDRLSPMFEHYSEVAAPRHVADRIQRTLREGRKVGRTVLPWRGIAAVTSAIAASLLLVVVTRAPVPPAPTPAVQPPPRSAPLIAALSGAKTKAPIAAAYDRDGAQVRIAGQFAVPAGRAAELWAIGKDGVPRALGLLATSATTRITLRPARRALLAPGVTLAVSIEPVGGSRTGLPTGPVIATGILHG